MSTKISEATPITTTKKFNYTKIGRLNFTEILSASGYLAQGRKRDQDIRQALQDNRRGLYLQTHYLRLH